jgi:hypothetical protein
MGRGIDDATEQPRKGSAAQVYQSLKTLSATAEKCRSEAVYYTNSQSLEKTKGINLFSQT